MTRVSVDPGLHHPAPPHRDLTPPSPTTRDALLAQVLPTVRAIHKRKSGQSLADDDTRHDNVDAIELYHEVIARLWERIVSGDAEGIDDLKGYAASVTHNAWSDYLREKYPRRTSLKNRLRYFLEHQPRYALWAGPGGEFLCGFRAWQVGASAAGGERIAALREGREKIAAAALPTRAFEQFDATVWDTLLDALFRRLSGPLGLDDLVSVTVQLIGLKEDRLESIDDAEDDEPRDELVDHEPTPDQRAEMRATLRQLWTAVVRLKPDYRCAYLLNLPGPGKSRSDLEVFVVNGIAGIAEIGTALGLDERQLAIAFGELALDDADRADRALLITPDHQFFLLWKYLPLADQIIGRMLGLGQQQVINRRMLAMRELARVLRGEKK